MDVILLNSDPSNVPGFTRTIGPYKLAHYLRKHGYDVQMVDFVTRFDEDELYAMITKFITPKTLAIALSMTFLVGLRYPWPNDETRRIPFPLWTVLRRIRKENPEIKFISGGYMSERMPDYGIFDATIMSYLGSNEDIMLEYLNNLRGVGPKPIGRLIMPSMRNHENRVRMYFDTPRNTTYNIEKDDFKWALNDCILPGEPLPLDVARGCIFACRFCQYPHLGKGKLDYIRGMNFIEEEMRSNYEKFGTTTYYMLDDTFNDTEFKMQEFYNMTQRLPFKINFVAYLRADLIHRFPNMAHLLKESGLIGAYHGLESLHPYASNLVGKAWSGKSAREFIPKLFHDTWKGEVPQTLSFIVGFPKETPDSILSTRDWFIDNKLHNCHFKGLGLFGRQDNKLYTVESEFDKNYEKYGFWFEEGTGKNEGRQLWRNETWAQVDAAKMAHRMNLEVKEHCKAGIWMIPGLMWSNGWSKEKVLTEPWGNLLKTEELEVLPERKELDENAVKKYEEYYAMIMAL